MSDVSKDDEKNDAIQVIEGYKCRVVEGIVFPPFLKSSCLNKLREQNVLKASDIVIATFPKCGTTWTQQIVLTLLAGGNKDIVRDPMEMSPWVDKVIAKEEFTIDEWNNWSPADDLQVKTPTRRVIKTHTPAHLAPWIGGVNTGLSSGGKVIVVTRNPKDTAVSLFHHSRDVGAFDYSGEWDHFLPKLFMPGYVEHGCFFAWHVSIFFCFPKEKLILLS